MRIGLLGGTFNPPHLGHLVCAQDAWAQLGLDRVLLLPVHTPPHKEIVGDPGVEHRVALCEAAVAGDERLGVSRAEADAPGRSFTVDTLSRLHDARPEDQLTFIVGGDMAASLPQWREPRAILDSCTIGVAARAFELRVDAACVYVNASTRFTDGGEFGMGAEIGNSTQKLHARGPIGLRELCTIKYLVEGDGQVRP